MVWNNVLSPSVTVNSATPGPHDSWPINFPSKSHACLLLAHGGGGGISKVLRHLHRNCKLKKKIQETQTRETGLSITKCDDGLKHMEWNHAWLGMQMLYCIWQRADKMSVDHAMSMWGRYAVANLLSYNTNLPRFRNVNEKRKQRNHSFFNKSVLLWSQMKYCMVVIWTWYIVIISNLSCQ